MIPPSPERELIRPAAVGPLYLGVDGGGTQVRAVLVDAAGREVARGAAGSANPSAVGRDAALQSIRAAVEQAAGEAGVDLPVAAACFGLAGVDRAAERGGLVPLLADFAREVRLANDAELGLEALPGSRGVCLIAGTGSIALGRDSNGRTARAGGWGYIVGDEGSGYDIGRRALRAVARAADGRGPETALHDAVLRAWNLRSAQELITHVYADARPRIVAGLAGLVFEQAAAGDRAARRIVAGAARELAAAVLAVAERLSFEGDLPLAMVGGVLRRQPRLRRSVVRRVGRVRPVGRVEIVEDVALAAARALAAAARGTP